MLNKLLSSHTVYGKERTISVLTAYKDPAILHLIKDMLQTIVGLSL